MWMIVSFFQYLIDIIFPKSCYGCKHPNISLCEECLRREHPPLTSPYPFIASLYSFKSPLIRKGIHAIKYFNRKDLILPFAKVMADEIRLRNLSGTIIPIPMHGIRKMIRGYNQAEILAKEVARLLHFPYEQKILIREKLTRRQVKAKTRKERLMNQDGAFKVSTKDLKDRNIILIDDVTTTGSTLLEAKRILERHGAKKVVAVTIAH